MNLLTVPFVLLTVVVLLNLLLGVFVYLNNPKSKTNLMFSFLALVLSVWLVINYFSLQTISETTNLFLARASISLGLVQVLLVFLLSHTLPYADIQLGRKLLIFILAASGIIFLLTISPLVFVEILLVGGTVVPVIGPGMGLFMVYALALSINAFYTFYKRMRNSKGQAKQQLQFVLLGITLLFVLIILTILIPIGVFKNPVFVPFSPLYVFLFLAMSAYAIIRHKFLDIRLLVARTVSYTIAIFIVVLGYVLLLFAITAVDPELRVSAKQIIAFSAIGLILFFTAGTLRKFIEQTTDRFFFKGRYDPEKLLSDLTHHMAEEINIETLSKKLLTTLNEQMRIIKSALIIIDKKANQVQIIKDHDGKKYELANGELESLLFGGEMLVFEDLPEGDIKAILRKHDISVFMSLKSGEYLIGYLVLGSKLSGDIYTSGDIDVLEIFAPEAAVALQNSLAYLEIQEFSKTLEKKVIERTAQLKETQGRELAKANELLKLKDEFVFIATHDLRTPVTAIEGYISMINEEKPQFSEETKVHFKAVEEASERLKQLVNDLLQVARSESGTIKVDVAPLDMNELIDRIVREVSPSAEAKKTKLVTNLDQGNKRVLADDEKLYEVIENLMSNAIKFNKPDGSVTISTKKVENMLEVQVADTGHGIPKAEQEKVFQKFFKFRGDTTADVPGTGLGLFVVRMLIEKMGGKIGFSSEEEKGTTFTFTLPLAV